MAPRPPEEVNDYNVITNPGYFLWLNVVCYGEIVDGFPVLRNDIPVTYGFCSSRNILCENNKTLYIERKVGRDYELPIYTWQCSSENTITISEENPTGAVRKLLSATKSIGKKKWKNVSSHFKGNACKKQQYKSSSSNNFKTIRKYCSSRVLQKALAIHQRNAGETSKLAKRHQERRNLVIHETVEFISFGDVKSKLNILSLTKMIII